MVIEQNFCPDLLIVTTLLLLLTNSTGRVLRDRTGQVLNFYIKEYFTVVAFYLS